MMIYLDNKGNKKVIKNLTLTLWIGLFLKYQLLAKIYQAPQITIPRNSEK